ncbi:hypothetical protein AS156_31515 [Bradyrhizobium macuxiense]|uniref:Uncharacterized protein n=1 Tax=Bradyrhizobium macuxiense TaxID=1755647 RepID=A0A109K1Y4_9BRAD|nr:DUF4286 family protein [Bradyrhizobium macuxiense]KWV59208.1 hypothetical protein AS156_31515 [Bradyrhizobium macuxiense]
MPIAGQGMLLTSMDVDGLHEAEFNRWYDREHIEERVAIDGFVEARRYVAHDGKPKYLGLYSTATFDVLDSPAYRTALANQTEWSKANIARFKNMIRGVARITISRGVGRGAALGLIRLRPPADGADRLRSSLRELLDPSTLDGIISMHLLENDPVLSRPLTPDAAKADPGAGDWFVLIDATDVTAVPSAAARITENAAFKPLVVTSGVYRLLWDLAKSDVSRN